MKMRTMLILTLLSVGLLLAGTGIAGITDPEVTKSIPASATLEGVKALTVEPVPYLGGTATSISFGDVPAGTPFATPTEYIKVEHDDNSLAWEIKIYTNNFDIDLVTWDPYDPAEYGVTPATATWGFQYGGMIGSPGARTPMAWHADTTDSVSSAFEVGTATDPVNTGWNFLKDKADRDDPGTTVDTPPIGEVKNESYEGPDATAAYSNVAFGGPDYQNVVDPRVPEEEGYSHPDDNKTFVVEVEGIFGSAPADTYTTTISFDLVHK